MVHQPGTPIIKVECNIEENDKLRFVLIKIEHDQN